MGNFLVTGASGFIGSTLCENLILNGHKVIGLDNYDSFYSREIKIKNLSSIMSNSSFQFIEGSFGDIEKFNLMHEIDFVIHLAAKAGVRPSIQNPSEYIENNISQTCALFTWMGKHKIKKLIFASSSSVYGNNNLVPFTESDVVDSQISPYAFTKKSGELLSYTFHQLYDFDVINLRFFTVYGERQRPDLAIYKFTKCILNEDPITLFGDGSTSRDYTYIGDIIQGINGAISYLNSNKSVYEIFNLGSKTPIRLLDLVKTLEKVIGKKAIIKWAPMQLGDVERTFANIEKAEKMLGYMPSMELEAGLKNFVNWIKLQENK